MNFTGAEVRCGPKAFAFEQRSNTYGPRESSPGQATA